MPQILGKEYQIFISGALDDYDRATMGIMGIISDLAAPPEPIRYTYAHLMLELIEAGFKPMTVADHMRALLEALTSKDSTKIQRFVEGLWYGTSDGIVSFGDKAKILLDAPLLKDINILRAIVSRYNSFKDELIRQYDPQTLEEVASLARIASGSRVSRFNDLYTTSKKYVELEGEELPLKYILDIGTRTHLTKGRIKSNPVWQILSRDKHLLNETVDAVFAKVKKSSSLDTNLAMGVFYGRIPKNLDSATFAERIKFIRDYRQEDPLVEAWQIDCCRGTWGSRFSVESISVNRVVVPLIGLRDIATQTKKPLEEMF